MTPLRAWFLAFTGLLFTWTASASPQGVSGFLTGPDNFPVTGARLTLTRTQHSPESVGSTTPDAPTTADGASGTHSHRVESVPAPTPAARGGTARTTFSVDDDAGDAASAKPAPPQRDAHRITGWARHAASSPQETNIQLSDAQGFFRFSPLPAGIYRLSVEADGYAPFVRTAIDVPEQGTIRLAIRLVPIRGGVGQVHALVGYPSPDPAAGLDLTGQPLTGLLEDPSSTGILSRVPGFSDDVPLPTFDVPTPRGPSFHGSTFAENQYRLDGLDVTAPSGLPGITLPLEFLERIRVATAGWSVMDGDTNGASINLSSRYGGNEFHGDLFFYLVPYQEAFATTEEQLLEGDRVRRQDRLLISGQSGFDLGGFVVRDRLWFFVGVGPQFSIGQTIRSLGSYNKSWERSSWQVPMVGRLTFNLTPDQTLQLSAYAVPGEQTGVIRESTTVSTGLNGEPSTFLGARVNRSVATLAHYALRRPQIRTRADLQLGYFQLEDSLIPDRSDGDFDGEPDGELAATTHVDAYPISGTSCGDYAECTPTNYQTGGYGAVDNSTSRRIEGRLTLSHRLHKLVGDHLLRYGAEVRHDQLDHLHRYTGNVLITEYSSGEVPTYEYQYLLSNELPEQAPDDYTTRILSTALSAYFQDTWNPHPAITLELGVRLDSQQLDDTSDQHLQPSLAVSPRSAIRYDYPLFRGGQLVFSYGRYATTVPLWLADAAFTTPRTSTDTVTSSSASATAFARTDAATSNATPSTQYSTAETVRLPSQDEVMAGVRQRLGWGFSAEAHVFYRSLTTTLEPLPYLDGALVMANPGTDPGQVASRYLEACYRATNPLTGVIQSYCYTTPERRYRALELHVTREPPDGIGLWLRAAYTLSRLEGDYPGPVPQPLGSEPTAVTSIYNQLNLTGEGGGMNRYGVLPGDRTHRLTADAALDLFLGFRIGFSVQARSGVPLDVVGRNPDGQGSVYLFPRGAGGRSPWVIDQAVSAGYQFRFREPRALTLEATVFNPLRWNAAIRQDPRYVLNVAEPVADATFSADTGAELRCVDPASSTTTACVSNPNWGAALEQQRPFGIRVMARVTF